MTFESYPQQYATDSAKVFFAISYLKKTALEWFKHGMLETDVTLQPRWRSSWPHFTNKLRTYFGPSNPVGDAEAELGRLKMNSDSHLTEYLVRFNTLAARVDWGDGGLRYRFYDGLPDRIKDRIMMLGKPDNLRDMVEVANHADLLHWEHQAEQKTSRSYQPARYPPFQLRTYNPAPYALPTTQRTPPATYNPPRTPST